ncbi:MAG: sugar phosphate isomerase/epimerase [Armatimonadetes bacterium]|nr:sugar phosphate isomerase/epimerase [Armatimonadota bacterium]
MELKLACGAWGFREYSLEAMCQAAKRLGFDYVELNCTTSDKIDHLPQVPGKNEIARMHAAAEAAGVRICGWCASNNFTTADETARKESVDVIRRTIDAAAAAQVPVVRVFAGWDKFETLTTAKYEQCAAALRKCGEHAEGSGVIVALENHGGPTATAAQVLRLLTLCDHPSVLANFDGGNFAHSREDPLAAYQVLRGQIGYTHWKDVKAVDGELEYTDLKQGLSDWPPVVQALLADNYQGFWTIEYEEPKDAEEGTMRCVEVIRAAAQAVQRV